MASKVPGGIRPNVLGHQVGPSGLRYLGIPPKTEHFRAAPPWSARTEGLGLHTGGRPRPQPGGRPRPAWLCPSPCPTRPSLVRLLVQLLHVAGPTGSRAGFHRTRTHSPTSGFRLPVSGPSLPCWLGLPRRAPYWWWLRERRRETSKGAWRRRLSVVRGSASDGGRGSLGFGRRPSPALSQALVRAVARYRRGVLRASLETRGQQFIFAGGSVGRFLLGFASNCLLCVWRFHSSLESLVQASPVSSPIPFIRLINPEWMSSYHVSHVLWRKPVLLALKEVLV